MKYARHLKRKRKVFNSGDTRLDSECVALCTALNRLPGIYTYESCCGHGQRPYWIWFRMNEDGIAGLSLLAELLCSRHVDFGFEVKLTFNMTFSKLAFLLESKNIGSEAFQNAERLAEAINARIESL
jgi:hypothetical protein